MKLNQKELDIIKSEFGIQEPNANAQVIVMSLLVMRRIVDGDSMIELPDGSTIAVVRVKKEEVES